MTPLKTTSYPTPLTSITLHRYGVSYLIPNTSHKYNASYLIPILILTSLMLYLILNTSHKYGVSYLIPNTSDKSKVIPYT